MRGVLLVVTLLGLVISAGHQARGCDVVLSEACATATAVQVQSHAVAVQAAPVAVQSVVPLQQQVIVGHHSLAVQALATPVVVQQHCVSGCANSAVRVRSVQRVRQQRVRSFSLQRSVIR